MTSLIACATGRPAGLPPPLIASQAAQAKARAALPDGLTCVGVAPGSRQPNKNWPLERFCEAASALAAAGLQPVVFLGPQEGEVEAAIAAASPAARVIRAGPDDGLDRLIAYAGRLAALLANDNGVGHLMGAAGVPVVSLFGPTDPARWAPVAPANRIVRAQDFGGGEEMAAIPVEAAVAATLDLLRANAARQDR
jgi:ADP-heptose:LPS heptosyltransferase